MKAHQQTIGKSDEYCTPRWILDPLGEFDLDPCSPVVRPWPTAKTHYTIENDGLKLPWQGRIWMNPPFTRGVREQFMERMSAHNNGIMLIPAACETEAFQKFVFGKASGILMLDKRPIFLDTKGDPVKCRNKRTGKETIANSGCTICLVAYGQRNLDVLIRSRLGVVLREAA